MWLGGTVAKHKLPLSTNSLLPWIRLELADQLVTADHHHVSLTFNAREMT